MSVHPPKMVHAALLLLMLEAVPTDLGFTISLKRSTQNLQLSTAGPADHPIFWLSTAGGSKDEALVAFHGDIGGRIDGKPQLVEEVIPNPGSRDSGQRIPKSASV